MAGAPAVDRVPDVLLRRHDDGEDEQHGRRVTSRQAVNELVVVAELDVLEAKRSTKELRHDSATSVAMSHPSHSTSNQVCVRSAYRCGHQDSTLLCSQCGCEKNDNKSNLSAINCDK